MRGDERGGRHVLPAARHDAAALGEDDDVLEVYERRVIDERLDGAAAKVVPAHIPVFVPVFIPVFVCCPLLLWRRLRRSGHLSDVLGRCRRRRLLLRLGRRSSVSLFALSTACVFSAVADISFAIDCRTSETAGAACLHSGCAAADVLMARLMADSKPFISAVSSSRVVSGGPVSTEGPPPIGPRSAQQLTGRSSRV